MHTIHTYIDMGEFTHILHCHYVTKSSVPVTLKQPRWVWVCGSPHIMITTKRDMNKSSAYDMGHVVNVQSRCIISLGPSDAFVANAFVANHWFSYWLPNFSQWSPQKINFELYNINQNSKHYHLRKYSWKCRQQNVCRMSAIFVFKFEFKSSSVYKRMSLFG